MGDAEVSWVSSFFREKLAGKAPVKDLEYGSRVSVVVSLAITQYPYF